MRTVRVVVADQSEARFFDSTDQGVTLRDVGRLVDSEGRKKEHDLVTDGPGSAVSGGHGHYALQHRSSRKEHDVELFARQVVARLVAGSSAGEFDDITIMAAPRFLGALRKAMPPAIRSKVKHEIHHDLVHQSEEVIRAHLPERGPEQ
jgi:protein required for attachment to host cells